MARINDQITQLSKPELIRRTTEANAWKADCYVSIHNNSTGGGGHATGTETFVQRQVSSSHDLGRRIQTAVLKVMGRPDRGVKVRELAGPIHRLDRAPAEWGRDYYHVLRETNMPAALVEVAFMDHPEDAKVLREPEALPALGRAIAGAIIEWGQARGLLGKKGTPIMGEPEATEDQARAWLAAKKAPAWAPSLVSVYWLLGARYGVRPDVALAQACKETAFFRFGGAVTPDQHNPCGLKVKSPTGDRREDHATFVTWLEGIEAHIQHLFCYATTDTLPGGARLLDPRWEAAVSAYGRGSAPTVEALGGKWAPSPEYGRSIVRDFLASLLATDASTTTPDNEAAQKLAYVVAENVALRSAADRERARADELQARVDRAIQVLSGG